VRDPRTPQHIKKILQCAYISKIFTIFKQTTKPIIMKLFISTLTAITLTAYCFAQPVITATSLGTPGTVVTLDAAVGTGFDIGLSGADINWDFSTLTLSGVTETLIFSEPEGTPYAADFTTATFALENPVDEFAYYIADADEFTIIGNGAGGIAMVYDDPRTLFSLPITFHDMSSDAFYLSYMDGVENISYGTTSWNADAYGTLKLPGGDIHNNVLRVQVQTTQTDSLPGDLISIYMVTTVVWMNAANAYPLVTYDKIDVLFPVPASFQFMRVATDITTEVMEPQLHENSLSLVPNPAQGSVHIQTIAGFEPEQITVTDLAGSIVLQQSIVGNTASISLENIPSGIYLVRASNKERSVVDRLVVTK